MNVFFSETNYMNNNWMFLYTLQKLDDFIETKAKKSPTSPGLVSPGTSNDFSRI
jgi:hypothetical protein